MTDQPTEQAKKLACELANAACPDAAFQPMIALALYIDKVDGVARDAVALIENCEPFVAVDNLRSLMLPDEPDPLEEAMEAAWNSLPVGSMHWGKPFVQATRAELKKRGLTIAEEK